MSDDDWEKPDFQPDNTVGKKGGKVGNGTKWDGEDESDSEDEESSASTHTDKESTPLPPTPAAPAAAQQDRSAAPTMGAKAAPVENGASIDRRATKDSIDHLNPVTAPEFEVMRNNIEKKFETFASSPFYPAFVDDLVRDLFTALPPDSIKKVTSSLNTIINDKTAAQLRAQKGKTKKGGKKGPSVKMERTLGGGEDGDGYTGYSDDEM